MAGNGPEDQQARKTRRVVRLWIAAGVVFALTVLGYSGIMVYLAQQDYPGSVVHNYFENYDRFNQFAEKLEKQEKLGWRLATRVESLPLVGKLLRVQVVVRDDQGKPLTGADVRVSFVRNVKARQDQRVRLADVGGGRYEGNVRLAKPGNWTIRTMVRQNGHRYRAQRFLWVEEPLE
ncbi:FixH family protein [Thiohalorhabdus sp.]|uniref:FixH family protein n=1 Tax=Thiohalorhabdus sp. TaxID=3094134 RepID=UPI002FC3D881